MKMRLCLVVCATVAVSVPVAASASDEPDALIGGKVVVVKTGKLAKFVAKPPKGQEFVLPSANNDPTVEGATLRIFDTGGAAGDVTYSLPAGSWSGLGNPAGAKGFKFKGAGCKIALVKPKVIKAVCKENVLLTTPFSGTVGIILTVGTDSKRYCAEFGGQEKKNDVKLTKRKDAPPPPQCPEPQAPATAMATATATGTAAATLTATPTGTAAATITATATATGTAAATVTATATSPFIATATATGTGTAAATATATPISPSPTPTSTPGVVCPLSAGSYTVTQGSGGTLDVYNFAPFPFPSGGSIVQDVSAGDANCVHNTVVPFPGGFSAPNFCVPALQFTTSVTQTACGIGRIDSNGGSDFMTTEIADTSSPMVCGLPQSPCTNGANSGIQVNITVGDASPDTCASGGTANALVSVPVHTVSWSDTSGGTFNGCPGNGVFDGGDMVAAEFDQILDFTTDTATGSWSDLDPDGCTIAGFGPAAGYTRTGVCIDIGLGTVTPVAVGEFGATGGLFDGTFATKLPSTFSGPGAPLGATCASPPVINYGGPATRCIP